jgi:RNA polymerase sigma factor (sigma-70 family)
MRRYKAWVSKDDVIQECYLWAIAKGQTLTDYLSETDEEQRVINEKRAAYQMRRHLERYCRREKAAKSGYNTGDESFYDTATIAQLLPYVITSIVNETALEQAQTMINDGSPRKPPAPAEGGNMLAILIDIKKAYEKLEQDDKEILRMRYLDDLTLQQIGQYFECSTSSADRRCNSALRKIQNLVGGDTPWS